MSHSKNWLLLFILSVFPLFAYGQIGPVPPSGGGAPSGPAGGALGGTYPNPTVVGAINPSSIGATTPGTGAFTALSATSGITSTSDGVHAGLESLVGNTTLPSLPSNTVNDIGPSVAGFTSYAIQKNSVGPSSVGARCVSALVSGVSQESFCPFTGAGSTIVLSTSPTITTSATVSNNSIGSTPADGLVLSNTTAAASGAQQYSPNIHWIAQGWKTAATAASETTEFREYAVPLQETSSPLAYLYLDYQTNGGGWYNIFQLSNFGYFTYSGLFQSYATESKGTTFTASGCGTPTSLTGGPAAGSFLAQSTSCTAVITIGGGQTTDNGWSCSVWDVTTTTDTLKETAYSTSTVTFSGTVVSGDKIVFGCIAF